MLFSFGLVAAGVSVVFLIILGIVGTGAAFRVGNGWVFNARNVVWSALIFGLLHLAATVAAVFFAAHYIGAVG